MPMSMEVHVGDPVAFRDFDDYTVTQVFSDGSVEIENSFGSQTVPQGMCRLKRSSAGSEEKLDAESEERRKLRDEADLAMEAILSQHQEPVEAPSANAWLSKKTFRARRNHEVYLNVYDLDQFTGKLNDFALRKAGMGAFHCGVEILGNEWFFAWGDPSSTETGVLYSEPRGHQVHVFNESISMGFSPLTEDEVNNVILAAMEAWPGSSYHIVHRNCAHFAEDLLRRLQCLEPFPTWVRGGAETAGKHPVLQPIAEWGWSWMRWCATEPRPVVVEDGRGDADASANCFCARPNKRQIAG